MPSTRRTSAIRTSTTATDGRTRPSQPVTDIWSMTRSRTAADENPPSRRRHRSCRTAAAAASDGRWTLGEMVDVMEHGRRARHSRCCKFDRLERAIPATASRSRGSAQRWVGGDFDKLLRAQRRRARARRTRACRRRKLLWGHADRAVLGHGSSACATTSVAARPQLGRVRRAGPRAVLVRSRRDRVCRRRRTHGAASRGRLRTAR